MKKLLTALVVVLLLWALPSIALAEASGTCGDQLTWTFTDDGVLTISGEGEMDSYFIAADNSFWKPEDHSVTSLVVGDGVTSIGQDTFDYCTSLVSVTLGNSVTSIGASAFRGCTSLTSVHFPDSLTSVRKYAFYDCTSLTSISLPNSVTTIGQYAFNNCAIKNFTFPESITEIQGGTFSGSLLESITIPENITYIADSAFASCENLNSVTLHNGDLTIKNHAFRSCPNLASIFVPDNVTVEMSAFSYSSTIIYMNIGSHAANTYSTNSTIEFRDPDYPDCILCNNTVSMSDGTKQTYVWMLEYDNPDSTHVIVPEGVEYLYCTFSGNESLTSVTLPDSLKMIGINSFKGCKNLSSIAIPDNVTSIGKDAFFACTSLTGILEMPASLTTLDNAFSACSNLTGLVLPDHMTEVNIWYLDLYVNRESETALTIGADTSAGAQFIDPDYPELYLKTYKKEDGELYYEVVDAKPTITTINASTFPEGTTAIGMSAFAYCDKLTSVTIPEYITELPTEAFYRCSQLKSVTLHDKISTIHWYAFAFSGIESIYLPGSIGEVSTWLFQGCESLKNVTLGEGITAINDYAFGGVTNLKQIYIPSSVISIGEQSGSDVVYDPDLGKLTTKQFTFNGKSADVYCYEFSYAEHWGNTECRQAILLDGKDTDEILTVSIPEELLASTDLPFTIPASIFPVTNDQVVAWTSSRPTVATIDNEGVLTPLNAGVTTITLTVNGVSASCTVTVRASLKSMLLPETVYAVAKGGLQLPLQIVPADAAVELTYTMAADNFGSISSTGWITAPSYITTPSTTTITVRDEMSGKEATTQLCITYPVTAISFAQPTVQVMGGESALLTANVTMRSDSCVNQLVTFTSSDTGIATVDAFGCVKGFKPGSATITATADSGVTATCEVIVGASGLSGDLSGDEAVTVDDVLALMDSLADPDGYSDVADVDKDADVDQDDMLLLMQYLSGWGVKLQ